MGEGAPPGRGGRLMAPIGAASALVVIFVVVLTIPLSAADSLALSERETIGWIMALYGAAGLTTLVLVARYRQPLLMTGNIFLLIFVASLGDEVPWPELVGAAMLAGAIVLVLGPIGLVGRLARWIPAPIVSGLLAGVVVHFFVDLFTALGDEPLMVGATLVAYVAARRWLEPRIPALLPALVVGTLVAVAAGELGSMPRDVELVPTLTVPQLSLAAVLTVTPVTVVLLTVQSNVPSLVMLRRERYDPPDQVVNAVSGGGSILSSFFGPTGLSLSLPATALCAGPDAGPRDHRHLAAYFAGAASLAIGLAAGFAAAIAQVLPRPLLLAFVGLAVLRVLAVSIEAITRGPLTLGPLFAFGVVQSELEIAELGPYFWALVIGIAVSLVLEPDGFRQVRTTPDQADAGATGNRE